MLALTQKAHAGPALLKLRSGCSCTMKELPSAAAYICLLEQRPHACT